MERVIELFQRVSLLRKYWFSCYVSYKVEGYIRLNCNLKTNQYCEKFAMSIALSRHATSPDYFLFAGHHE